MIAFPAGVRVWIAGGVTDMRCGMNSLALKVQRRWCFGKTPMQTFLDAKPLAQEKMIAA